MKDSLPANIELEQTVLGSLLMFPDCGYATQIMDSSDFSATEHQQIFSLIAAAAQEGRHLTPVSLGPSIGDLKFGKLKPQEYLSRLVGACSHPQHLQGQIGELKQLSGRRRLISLGQQMEKFARTPSAPLADHVIDAVHELDFVSSTLRRQRQSMRSLGAVVADKIENLRAGEISDFIHTGLIDLNKAFGGWHRGELAIIAARPSMGKTAFALSALRQAAMHGTSSLFFSMEISADQVACRMLADAIWNSQSPISYAAIDQHKLQTYDIDRLARTGEEINRLPLQVDDQRGLTVSEIGARARRVKADLERQGRPLDVICIDHLGKIRASDRYSGNKVHETGEKTNALAQLALDLNVAVIALQQLNRGVEGREDKRPTMPDLRDSGNIEEDADTVSFLYRPAYYLERSKCDKHEDEENRLKLLEIKRNVLELIISKNRRGSIGTRDFFTDIACNVIRDRV